MKKYTTYLYILLCSIITLSSCTDDTANYISDTEPNANIDTTKRRVSNPKIDYSIGEKTGRPSGGSTYDPIHISAIISDQLLLITLKVDVKIDNANIKMLDSKGNTILMQKKVSIDNEIVYSIVSKDEGFPYYLKLENDTIDFWAYIHGPGQESWFPNNEE